MSLSDTPWNYTSTTTPFPFVTATYNPRLQEKIYGDFTSFYVTITICTVLGAFLFLLNIALCCCSRYKKYWQDSNTGKYIIHFCFTKTSRNNAIVLTQMSVPCKLLTVDNVIVLAWVWASSECRDNYYYMFASVFLSSFYFCHTH
jgi:hypothetical protein